MTLQAADAVEEPPPPPLVKAFTTQSQSIARKWLVGGVAKVSTVSYAQEIAASTATSFALMLLGDEFILSQQLLR